MTSLVYSTQRVVNIPNRCLGLTYTVIVIAVILYIGGYGLYWSKGYQTAAPVESVVVTKVKGILYTDFDDKTLGVPYPEFYRRVWDASDIVIPAYGGEFGGFFILTDVVITPNQTRGLCGEDHTLQGAICRLDKDCKKGGMLPTGNGIFTGKCIRMKAVSDVKTCEIHAWCPLEESGRPLGPDKALLVGTQEFTVLVKNSIEFPALGKGYARRNILESATREYLQSCIYDPMKDPYCPTFRIGDIVKYAGDKYEVAAVSGALYGLKIEWFCDFDWGRTVKHCMPKYSFARLDNPNTAVSPGFNFWSAVYHEENRRTLTKNYGIKILIIVEGEGRKFDSVKFILAIGAGVGLFAVASFLCDFIFSIFCLLKQYVNWNWLRLYDEEMKYDLTYVKAKEERRRLARENNGGEEMECKVNLRG